MKQQQGAEGLFMGCLFVLALLTLVAVGITIGYVIGSATR